MSRTSKPGPRIPGGVLGRGAWPARARPKRKQIAEPDRDTPEAEEAGPPVDWKAGLAPCLFYLFIEFSRPMAWIPGVAELRPGVLALVWSVAVVLFARQRPLPRPIWFAWGFALLMAVHVPLATNTRWAWWGLRDCLLVFAGGMLPLSVLPRSVKTVRVLLTAFVYVHVPAALYALTHQGHGPGGWMDDENDLSLALNAAIGVSVYLILDAKNWRDRLALVGCGAILLSAVVASISRGGFVGLALVAVYVFVVGPHRKVIAFCGVLAILGLALFAPAAYWDEMQTISTAAEPGDTGETRLYFWGIAWDMFVDHPLIGVGTRNYGIHAPDYQDPNRIGWRTHTWGRVAHSLYFTLIAEQGIVGTLLFGGIILWCFRAVRRIRRALDLTPDDPQAQTAAHLATGASAGMFAVLSAGAFLSVLYYPIFWILVAIIASLSELRDSVPRIVERTDEVPARHVGDLWAGAEVSALATIRELSRRSQFSVRALVLNPGELSQRLERHGVPTTTLSERTMNRVSLCRAVLRCGLDFGPDVVHSHRYKENLLGAAVAGLTRALHVRTLHGLPHATSWAGSAVGLGPRLDASIADWSGSIWVVVSRDLRRLWAGIRRSIHVVPNGLPRDAPAADRAALDLAFDSGEPSWYVGFVGRLEPVKAPDRFLRIVANLPARIAGRPLRAVVVGGGAMEPALRAEVERLQLDRRVRLLGHRDDADRLIGGLDALVVPSRHEGHPMVLLEAMRAAVPVVCTAVGGIPEMLGSSEWVIAPDREADLCAALQRLLEQEKLRHGWSAALREVFLRKGTIERSVDRLIEVYRGPDPWC